MIDLEKARSQLEELKLDIAADLLESRLQQAVQQDATYVSFLADLLQAELAERQRRNIETSKRRSAWHACPIKRRLRSLTLRSSLVWTRK